MSSTRLFYCEIPGRVGVLKNSKQILTNRRTGRPFIASSDRYTIWARTAFLFIRQAWLATGQQTITVPVNAEMHFYFENRKHIPDQSNAYCGVEDLLQKAGVLFDDKLIGGHDRSRRHYGFEPKVTVELTLLDGDDK